MIKKVGALSVRVVRPLIIILQEHHGNDRKEYKMNQEEWGVILNLPDCPNIMTSWPEAEACCPEYCRPTTSNCECKCHSIPGQYSAVQGYGYEV